MGNTGQNLLRWLSHASLPHRGCDGDYLHVHEIPAHTVAYQYISAVVRIELVHFGKLLAQTECRIQRWIARGISEHPKLIAFAQLWVGLYFVDGL